MCKAITKCFVWTPIAVALAQGFLYAQQPFCQPWTATPENHVEIFGGEAEAYYNAIQPQFEGQWRAVPVNPIGGPLTYQQLPYFSTVPNGVLGLQTCPSGIPCGPPAISYRTHTAPPLTERPVLRFLVRPRRPAQGRTT